MRILKHIMSFSIFSLSLATPAFSASEKILPVPFTPQAPYANWSQPWQDACEEAVIVMVDYFYSPRRSIAEAGQGYQGQVIPKGEAAAAIRRAYDLKNQLYGWSWDENAEKIARWINDFYGWEARLIENPTLEQMRAELTAGRPVIVPVHGRSLSNPYFTAGGPDYHTLVISGYDDDAGEFIVEEPGTRRGLDFRYPYARILDAIHDYVPGSKTKEGRPVAIFTAPLTSAYINNKIVGDTLLKAPNHPAVYLLQHGVKRHIASEQVFLAHGWRWGDIITVSSKFLSELQAGSAVK